MHFKCEQVERMHITGPVKDRKKALDYCEKHGYSIRSSGIKQLASGKLHFVYIVERAI